MTYTAVPLGAGDTERRYRTSLLGRPDRAPIVARRHWITRGRDWDARCRAGCGTLRLMGGMPETRYARSGGLSIAYQDVGDGVPVVWVPGFVSHVEMQRELPCWSGFIERVERFARFITFDKRGTGLSDRSLGVGTLEDRMDDIRAVYDVCRLDRAVLIGVSEGGPLSILFAATYPERVSHLVIYGSYTHGSRFGRRGP